MSGTVCWIVENDVTDCVVRAKEIKQIYTRFHDRYVDTKWKSMEIVPIYANIVNTKERERILFKWAIFGYRFEWITNDIHNNNKEYTESIHRFYTVKREEAKQKWDTHETNEKKTNVRKKEQNRTAIKIVQRLSFLCETTETKEVFSVVRSLWVVGRIWLYCLCFVQKTACYWDDNDNRRPYDVGKIAQLSYSLKVNIAK